MRVVIVMSVVWLVAMFGSLGPVAAQTPAKPAAKPAAKMGPKRAELERQFVAWKELLAEMVGLSQRFVAAEGEDRRQIENRYDELLGKGDAMHTRLIKAVEEAYAEDPASDVEMEMYLGVRCRALFEDEEYEEVVPLAKLMIDHGAKEKRLYLWGGAAAFCTGDLDTAKEYLAAAVKRGAGLESGKGDPLDPTVAAFYQDPRRYEEAWKKEQAIRAKEAEANDLPRVLLKTNRGDIEIELFENEAPNTVANFITLVENGFYDGLTFHRVLPAFMIQGGCPKGDGSGGPGYTIPCECNREDQRNHFRGSLSMAHAGPNTGGSQFFITIIPTVHLNGIHTVFGRVVKGMNVLAEIQKRDPSDAKETLGPADEIVKAIVLRKRPHPYEVKKQPEAGKGQ